VKPLITTHVKPNNGGILAKSRAISQKINRLRCPNSVPVGQKVSVLFVDAWAVRRTTSVSFFQISSLRRLIWFVFAGVLPVINLAKQRFVLRGLLQDVQVIRSLFGEGLDQHACSHSLGGR
jgi:hypothetical protein